MANITPRILKKEDNWAHGADAVVVVWENIGQGDVPLAFKSPVLFKGQDKVMTVKGTFGGATITPKFSIEPGDSPGFYQYSNEISEPVSFTAAGGSVLLEAAVATRPDLSGDTGTTDLTVHLLITGGN